MSTTARIPHIRERLDSWAVWLRTGGVGQGSSPLARLAEGDWTSDGYRPYVPVEAIECSVTDDAVNALPVELREAVVAWHMNEGTLDGIAKRIRVCRVTLCRRLRNADLRISDWLERRAIGRPCNN